MHFLAAVEHDGPGAGALAMTDELLLHGDLLKH
jgi:hypothetical protein